MPQSWHEMWQIFDKYIIQILFNAFHFLIGHFPCGQWLYNHLIHISKWSCSLNYFTYNYTTNTINQHTNTINQSTYSLKELIFKYIS
jgi:hypothetical protein